MKRRDKSVDVDDMDVVTPRRGRDSGALASGGEKRHDSTRRIDPDEWTGTTFILRASPPQAPRSITPVRAISEGSAA
jgi:hypothetical protein